MASAERLKGAQPLAASGRERIQAGAHGSPKNKNKRKVGLAMVVHTCALEPAREKKRENTPTEERMSTAMTSWSSMQRTASTQALLR